MMMNETLIYDNLAEQKLADFDIKWPRISSRGIVLKDDKMFAFVKQNTGQYKLPGGGKEGAETPEQTFVREVLEETGYTVKNIRKLGITKGYTQISYVFTAKVDRYIGVDLDDGEIAENSRSIQITPQEFLEKCGAFLKKYEDKSDEDSLIKYAISLRDYHIVKYSLEKWDLILTD